MLFTLIYLDRRPRPVKTQGRKFYSGERIRSRGPWLQIGDDAKPA